uniref:Uncharacterized protein n=1 Tax=Escherichia coli TaxID=562 RepID=A0A2S0NSU1_ECOLX|nr:hypothetical protein [Escherichia coli]
MGVYVDKEFRVKRKSSEAGRKSAFAIKLKMVVKTINATFRNVSTARVPVRRLLSKSQEVRLPGREFETVLTI